MFEPDINTQEEEEELYGVTYKFMHKNGEFYFCSVKLHPRKLSELDAYIFCVKDSLQIQILTALSLMDGPMSLLGLNKAKNRASLPPGQTKQLYRTLQPLGGP